MRQQEGNSSSRPGFRLRMISKPLMGVALVLDWFLRGLSASRLPDSHDELNARFGLDRRDSMGEIVGGHGYRPGERPPPR
jgi:hypothetical protein